MTTDGNDDFQAGAAKANGMSEGEAAEVAEIRADIEGTRHEMGGTLNELGERLEPGHLVQQVKDNVHDATIGRVEETAKGVSEMVMETIKRNPIPAALAGAGLAMLWANRGKGEPGPRLDPVTATRAVRHPRMTAARMASRRRHAMPLRRSAMPPRASARTSAVPLARLPREPVSRPRRSAGSSRASCRPARWRWERLPPAPAPWSLRSCPRPRESASCSATPVSRSPRPCGTRWSRRPRRPKRSSMK